MISANASPANTRVKNILIVDDQETMAELWKMKFSQMGFDIVMAKDGEQAIDALNMRHFDIILLDLYMPKKDGFDVLARKGETLNRDTPTYVITSSVRDEDITKAKKLGATRAFIKYQTSPKEVIDAVQAELA